MIRMILRLLAVARDYRGRIRTAFVFAFLKSILTHAPIIIGYFVIADFLNGTMTERKCLMAGIAMVLCVAIQCVCQHLADRLQSGAGFEVFADLRMKLGEHLRHLPMGYFTEGNIGKISSVLSTDMVFIESNCMMEIANMMNFLFSQLILTVFLFFFDWRVALLSILVCGVMLLIGRGMTRDALGHSAQRQEQSEKLTDAVLDFAEGIGIIKAYNLLGERQRSLSENFRRSCETSLGFEEAQTLWARRLFLVWAAGTAAVLGLTVRLFLSGEIALTYFVGLLLFVFSLFTPLRTFYTQIARLTVMDSCLDRIEAVFAESEMADEGREHLPESADNEGNGAVPEERIDAAGSSAITEDKNDVSGNGAIPEIEYRGVHFAYGENEVLHDVSFSVRANEMLALVGPSGGGKSTIASLLARLWDVSGGAIYVRGRDIRDVPLAELMSQISVVFQRVYLFRDSVYSNIVMGRPEASREEVIAAAKKARCHDFIMALPEGYETVIGEGGASLSGGEMQRISIARCILKDTPIVILDEATASVDADNERYIQQAISELVRGKTLIVIAHRLHTIRGADQILVVSDGEIIERGKHEELMREEGTYFRMVEKRRESPGWSSLA